MARARNRSSPAPAAILERTDGTAPRLVAVITEASLLYRWGIDEDRAGQLDRLVAIGSRPGIELRMLRLADGPHPGMSSLIDIFDFPDAADPSVVYLESDTDIAEVTKAADVRAYRDTFARIQEAALSPQLPEPISPIFGVPAASTRAWCRPSARVIAGWEHPAR